MSKNGKKVVNKTDNKNFIKALKVATVEKDVENAYRDVLKKYYGGNFTSPYGCDGYLNPDKDTLFDSHSLRLLLEVKWQKNLNDGVLITGYGVV